MVVTLHQLFGKMLWPLHNNLPNITFPVCDSVVKLPYCSQTGNIANTYCPIGGEGYYKSTNKADGACNAHVSATVNEEILNNNMQQSGEVQEQEQNSNNVTQGN